MFSILAHPYYELREEDVNEELNLRPSASHRWRFFYILGICCFVAGALSVEGFHQLNLLEQHPAELKRESRSKALRR